MKIKKYFLEKSKIGLLLMSFWCMSSLTIQAQDHVHVGNISVSTQAARPLKNTHQISGKSQFFCFCIK